MVTLDVLTINSTLGRLVNGLAFLAGAIMLVTFTILEGEVPRLVSMLVQAKFVDRHFTGTTTRDFINESHDTNAEPENVDGGDGEEGDSHTPDGLPLGVVGGGGVVTDTVETEVGTSLNLGVVGKEEGARSVLGGDTSGGGVEATEHFL